MNRFSTARVFRAMALLAFAQIFQSQGALARPDEWLAPLTPRSASMVIDARTGESLFASNPDLRLPPASLVKMMTLYLAFRAVETGEISLDSLVTISDAAANQSPPRLGLAAGQQIALRYLIRATAVQSANDAAVALAEALAGTEPAFVTMMNARAAAFGMENTSFANATGLSREGQYSTARDMAALGRRLLYDFPQYFHIFSTREVSAGIRKVVNTNRRFLQAYAGAEGIKSGYTADAGFTLVASARRHDKRVIAAVFGAASLHGRTELASLLLDLGFRTAPAGAQIVPPKPVENLAEARAAMPPPRVRPVARPLMAPGPDDEG